MSNTAIYTASCYPPAGAAGVTDHVWALEEQLGNKVVSSETIECDECSEVHTALVLIYENSRTNVICEGDCYDCKYWPHAPGVIR